MRRTVRASFFIGTLALSSASFANVKPIEVAIRAFQKYGKAVTTLSLECRSFVEDGPKKEPSGLDVTVREKHDSNCGGDPNTAPSVAHLRVKGNRVFIMDSLSGKYKILNSKYKSEF